MKDTYELARSYHEKMNYKKAFNLYSKGAESGDERCYYGIALFYHEGYYVNKNEEKANNIFAEHYKKIRDLAEHGDDKAMLIMAYYYNNGFAVVKNKRVTHAWINKAYKKGNFEAIYIEGNFLYNNQNIDNHYDKAIECYEIAAAHNHSKAEMMLGYIYDNGTCVEKDYQKAYDYYLRAIKHGSIDAIWRLGYMFGNGKYNGIEDKETMAKYFCKAASKHSVVAEYLMATCYRDGCGVEKDEEKRLMWLRKAAKDGHVDAMNELGNYYCTKKEPDYQESIKWYKKLADQNNLRGIKRLFIMYKNGYGVKSDQAKAYRILQKAVAQNDLQAIMDMADAYYHGKGIRVNKDKAFELYKRAAGKGDSDAQYILGFMYERGEGTPIDYEKAKELYEISARKHNPYGYWWLGLMYSRGVYVAQNIDKAKKLYTKAMEYGNDDIKWRVGWEYIIGKYLKSDANKGIKLIQGAADKGIGKASAAMGQIFFTGQYTKPNYEKAKYYLEKAVARGDAESIRYLGEIYEEAKGVDQDLVKARKYYEKATSKGVAMGAWRLGRMYQLGTGVDVDIKKAEELYIKSTEVATNTSFLIFLANQYNRGSLGEVNHEKAYQIYSKAKELGDLEAVCRIGDMYETGDYLEKDLNKAIQMYKKAAKGGCSTGYEFLGNMYFVGKNVEKDLKKAVYYWKKSAELNDGSGCYMLGYAYMLGTGVKKNNKISKQYFDKAMANGVNCGYAYELLKSEDESLDTDNAMRREAYNLSIKKLSPKENTKEIVQSLKKTFGTVWKNLTKDTKNELLTGFMIYTIMKSWHKDVYKEMDFSAAILPMIKGLEIELSRVFYEGYINYLQKNNVDPHSFVSEGMDRLPIFLFKNPNGDIVYKDLRRVHDFTLGSFPFIVGVGNVIREKEGVVIKEKTDNDIMIRFNNISEVMDMDIDSNGFIVDETMLQYLLSIIDENAFSKIYRKKEINAYLIKIAAEIADITFSLRNKSAHATKMNEAQAATCGNYLFKNRKLMIDILSKVNYYKLKEYLM